MSTNEKNSVTSNNESMVNYNYLITKKDFLINNNSSMNIFNVLNLINKLDITINCNRVGALVGDKITYTIIVRNIYELTLNNIVIKVNLSENIQYLNGLNIEGILNSGNIIEGINLGSIDANNSLTITFNGKVKGKTGNLPTINTAVATYTYSINNETIFSESSISNENILIIYSPSIILKVLSNVSVIKEGDKFIYTITIENNGDIDILNGTLINRLPYEFSIEKIEIDDVLVTGNIWTGISVGTITKSSVKKIVLYIKVLGTLNGVDLFINKILCDFNVSTDPNFPVTIINKEATDPYGIYVIKRYISLKSQVDKEYGVAEDIVTYTLIVKNEMSDLYDNSDLYHIVVSDILEPELKFIPGTIKLDGVTYKNENITYGIKIPLLKAGKAKSISFHAQILAAKNTPIANVAKVEYKYKFDNYLPEKIDVVYSNFANLIVPLVDLTMVKEADVTEITVNGYINYTVILTNIGSVDFINTIFTDILPNNISLVDGSFKINGKIVNSIELDKGVSIGAINSGEILTLNYKVRVHSSSSNIKTSGLLNYSYELLDGSTGTKTRNCNEVIVEVI